jgi:hypothetical protein
VLLRGNSTHVYISYFPKTCNRPDHSISISLNIIEKIIIPKPKSSQRLEPRTVFGFVTSVPLISSPERTNLALAQFFYRAYFPSYRNHPRQYSNPGQFFGVLAFVPVICSPKQTTLLWHYSSIVLSFRTTENNFAGNRTKGSFWCCDL